MATKLTKIVADFETQLAAKTAAAGTTGTLQGYTDDDGVALPTGQYVFAVDCDNSQKEYWVATLGSSGALTGIKTITRQGTETSGSAREHRVGAKVKITDYAQIKYITDLLTGATDLDSTDPLKYDGTATISNDAHLATKKYVDDTALSGAPDATLTVKGNVELATSSEINSGTATGGTGAAIVVTPDALSSSNYSSYLPTSGQKDALPGNNTDVAVGSGNKYVTQTGLQHNAEKYAADAGSNDTYAITLSPVPTSYTAGMVVHFKANTANTGAATLNVNSLGAKTIKKRYNTDLDTNDILANQLVTVIYDGTNFVLQAPTANMFRGLYASGSTTYDLTTASGTQNIAHGLGVTPVMYKLFAVQNNTTQQVSISINNNNIHNGTTPGGGSANGGNSFLVGQAASVNQVGTVSADATNISISWTKTGSPTGTAYIIWEALA